MCCNHALTLPYFVALGKHIAGRFDTIPRVITSPANAQIKLIRALQGQRKAREAEGLFVAEGVRLVEEAARAHAPIQLVLHTPDLDERGQRVVRDVAARGARVEPVTEAVMRVAAETQTPAGLLAVIATTPRPWPAAPHWVLILDRLGDPGNLGTILRTAEAAGAQAVALAPGTVDAHNPKVVRAAMGAHFHLPIAAIPWAEMPEKLGDLTTWVATAHDGPAYDQVDWRKPSALIIGSEAEGPGAAALRFTTHRVHIPMPGRAESLNAAIAAGVLLFEAARQRKKFSAQSRL
jgi:TrmH family RNA methyltransferase